MFAEQHSTQGCVRAVLPGYSQQAQNTLLQSSSERYQSTRCHCLSFHFCSPKALATETLSLLMANVKPFEICCSPKWSAFGIPLSLYSMTGVCLMQITARCEPGLRWQQCCSDSVIAGLITIPASFPLGQFSVERVEYSDLLFDVCGCWSHTERKRM